MRGSIVPRIAPQIIGKAGRIDAIEPAALEADNFHFS
jgi:hypothetical protein